MHIEKNIYDNILGTIMNIKGNTKDTIKMRLDLERTALRCSLHLLRDGNKLKMPLTSYTLSLPQKQKFCQFLKELKFQMGFLWIYLTAWIWRKPNLWTQKSWLPRYTLISVATSITWASYSFSTWGNHWIVNVVCYTGS